MKSKGDTYLGENHLLLALIKQSDIVNKLSSNGNLNKNEFINAVQTVLLKTDSEFKFSRPAV